MYVATSAATSVSIMVDFADDTFSILVDSPSAAISSLDSATPIAVRLLVMLVSAVSQVEMNAFAFVTFLTDVVLSHVKLMSVGFLVDPDKAMVWRGPMASGALKQLLTETWWDDIDYMVVDMPPGTGDIQLTIAQTLPVSGAIIVSTPQKVALADVVRGVEMFQNPNINIPVLGFVENMAYFTPAELPDHKYYIFGKDGGKKMAQKYGIPLLGQIPLIQGIREGADDGRPAALRDDTELSTYYGQLAINLTKNL